MKNESGVRALILANEQMMAVPIREPFDKLRAGGVEESSFFAKPTSPEGLRKVRSYGGTGGFEELRIRMKIKRPLPLFSLAITVKSS